MTVFYRLAVLPFAALLASAAPKGEVIKNPHDPKLAIVIPAGSPVKFRGWKDGYAQFDGQFVLTGKYAVNLSENCEDGRAACIALDIEPDPAIAARLPYWTNRGESWGGDMWISIRREKRLVESIANPRQRAALVAGKIRYLKGRTAIVVDDFSTGVDCESVWFSARFVAVAKKPKLARTDFTGGVGCGA